VLQIVEGGLANDSSGGPSHPNHDSRGCARTWLCYSLGEDTGLRVRGGMNMKNLVRVAMLVMACASASCAQEAVVNVSSKGKQKWSPSEVDKVYLSACTAVQREFGDSAILRPPIALVLGADINAVDRDKKTILLERWDRTLFAQGVVILAFDDLLTPQRRRTITNRAVNWAQATVDVAEINK